MSAVADYAAAVFCGLGLALFVAACSIGGVRRARRVLARRRAARRFLEKVAGPDAGVVEFVGYGPAAPTFHPDDDEEAPR